MMKLSYMARTAIVAVTALSSSLLWGGKLQRYDIQLELTDSGKVIGTPRLVIDAGNEAKFEIGSIDGELYTATVTVVPKDGATVEITSMISARTTDMTRRSNYKTTATFEDNEHVVFRSGDGGKPDLALTAKLSRI
jgi:hypothetical protein